MPIDNYELFKIHEDEHNAWLKSRPKCEGCGHRIQDDECYNLGDGLYCNTCVEGYKVSTDNYIKEE